MTMSKSSQLRQVSALQLPLSSLQLFLKDSCRSLVSRGVRQGMQELQSSVTLTGTLVGIPHFVSEQRQVSTAKVYKQAVVILPLPNHSDLFVSSLTMSDH